MGCLLVANWACWKAEKKIERKVVKSAVMLVLPLASESVAL